MDEIDSIHQQTQGLSTIQLIDMERALKKEVQHFTNLSKAEKARFRSKILKEFPSDEDKLDVLRRIPGLELVSRATSILQRAKCKHPADFDDWPLARMLVHMGMQLARLGEEDLAAWALEYGVEESPDAADAMNSLAIIYTHKGKYDLALEWARRAVSSSPKMPHPLNSLGNVYKTMGAELTKSGQEAKAGEYYELALDAFERAIALAPDHPPTYFNRGYLWLLMGEKDKAVQDLKTCLSHDTNEVSRRNTVRLLESIGTAETEVARNSRIKEVGEGILELESQYRKDRVTILREGKPAAMYKGNFRTKLVGSFAPDDLAVLDEARRLAGETTILIVLKFEPPGMDLYKVEGVGSRCFIATAAFDSPLASEVATLSRFRDEVLLHSRLGAFAVRLYYFVSPSLAGFVSSSTVTKFVARLVLGPIVRWARKRSDL
ncbi:MAG: tetratricopeptide repeat protein [Candidatus Eisenbacteria bacterium]|nr:tetratricopeptide repeat protein [Candidatus Eisenbacteria bacterium]